MILILENFLENGGDKFDILQYAGSLLRWAYQGFAELGDHGGMGIGSTVKSVLYHEKFEEDPHKAAYDVWISMNKNAAANGAVMRTSVLGIPSFHDLDAVIENTRLIARVTHHDARCQASCIAITVAIALMLKGEKNVDEIMKLSEQHASKVLEDDAEQRKELHFHMNANVGELALDDNKAIGYTYKCMGSGFVALKGNDFRKTLRKIVMQAGDADTNGAVAGAILGCKIGYSRLPTDWLEGLPHKDWLAEKVEALCGLLGL